MLSPDGTPRACLASLDSHSTRFAMGLAANRPTWSRHIIGFVFIGARIHYASSVYALFILTERSSAFRHRGERERLNAAT
jgi:hypothetical protein